MDGTKTALRIIVPVSNPFPKHIIGAWSIDHAFLISLLYPDSDYALCKGCVGEGVQVGVGVSGVAGLGV